MGKSKTHHIEKHLVYAFLFDTHFYRILQKIEHMLGDFFMKNPPIQMAQTFAKLILSTL